MDDIDLYGGDEYMMKAAGHELRSLMAMMECRVSGLHFPLMVLVDHRGYRLIAMPLLPLGPDTLVYGSSDGTRQKESGGHGAAGDLSACLHHTRRRNGARCAS